MEVQWWRKPPTHTHTHTRARAHTRAHAPPRTRSPTPSRTGTPAPPYPRTRTSSHNNTSALATNQIPLLPRLQVRGCWRSCGGPPKTFSAFETALLATHNSNYTPKTLKLHFPADGPPVSSTGVFLQLQHVMRPLQGLGVGIDSPKNYNDNENQNSSILIMVKYWTSNTNNCSLPACSQLPSLSLSGSTWVLLHPIHQPEVDQRPAQVLKISISGLVLTPGAPQLCSA